MPGELDSIVALQKTLTELGIANEKLHGIPDWMRELHEEHSRQLAEIAALAEARDQAKQERRTAEAELSDSQEKQKHYQEQISLVSTQREYGALLKEIDTTKSQIASYEQQAMEAIESAEEAEKKLADLESSFQELDNKYKAELAKWEEEKPAVAKEVAKLEARAEKLRGAIPRPEAMVFDRLFERYDGNAVAPITRLEGPRKGNVLWHCVACSFNVRPQVMVEIRNGSSIRQCESCKRILYWEDEGD